MAGVNSGDNHLKLQARTEDLLLQAMARVETNDFNELLQILSRDFLDNNDGARSKTMEAVEDADSLAEGMRKHEEVLRRQEELKESMGLEPEESEALRQARETTMEDLHKQGDSLDPVRRELFKRGYHKRGDN